MDWTKFRYHGDSPDQAFEAFTGLLFEKWSQREFGDKLQRVVFINGAGGDGGVEAYAALSTDELVGLQAKWFKEPLESGQIQQIKKSVKTAAEVREGLTRYIVAVPRNLSDGKTKKKQRKTERKKWDDAVKKLSKKYPNISVELWDEDRLVDLLANYTSDGFEKYWFDEVALRHDDLVRQFEAACSGWLSERYVPDLHQTGEIENELGLRLRGFAAYPEGAKDVRLIQQRLEEAKRVVRRASFYPVVAERDGFEDLQGASNRWIDDAYAEQHRLLERIENGDPFPVVGLNNPVPGPQPLMDLSELLLESSLTKELGEHLNEITLVWSQNRLRPIDIERWGQPIAFIGEPGAGKTHAFASAVDSHLRKQMPAVLIRAKIVDLGNNWGAILSNAVDEPDWNTRQVLDAISAAAVRAEVRAAAEREVGETANHVRALVVIDGLDETPYAEQWKETLGELRPLAERYPRILFACTLRPALARRWSPFPNGFDRRWINESDASPADLFAAYCDVKNIDASPLLRWALGSPLAIKLFAELYEGQHVEWVDERDFSLAHLMAKKLRHAERSIREAQDEPWSDLLHPVEDTLRAIVHACLDRGEPLRLKEALAVADEGQRQRGVLDKGQLLRVLERCRDHGLLLVQPQYTDDPFEREVRVWEPAYEAVTDFLLAWTLAGEVEENVEDATLPKYIAGRRDSLILLASLLGRRGIEFIASGLWQGELSESTRERLEMQALRSMPTEQARQYEDWVRELFSRDMPSCRRVLRTLVIPNLRNPAAVYDANFVADVLAPMEVAERDLFWSGPNILMCDQDVAWGGLGERALEDLWVPKDDPWTAAPLLAAWATTTVNNKNRRRLRMALANWGRTSPSDLLKLLQETVGTNDPQMREDLLASAYGASCLVRPDEEWKPIAEWIVANFFGTDAPFRSFDIVVQHCARAVVERCLACGIEIDRGLLERVRNPEIDASVLLPIHKEAAQAADEHHGIEPATGDLAWNLVPRAINPFFKEALLYAQRDSKSDEDTDSPIMRVNRRVLESLAEGHLRPDMDDSVRTLAEAAIVEHTRKAEEMQAQAAVLNHLFVTPKGDGEDELSDNDEEAVARDELSDEELERVEHLQQILGIKNGENEEQTSSSVLYPEPAQSLLEQFADETEVADLTPSKIAFGFVAQFAADLGWESSTFIGDLGGGEIGADIAISRRFSRARHGRSEIATYGEKYVWAAVNHLRGYLSERLPAYDFGQAFEPPVDPSLTTEVVNPASHIGLPVQSEEPFVDYSELVPVITLAQRDQAHRAAQWVQEAPLPSFERLLLPTLRDVADVDDPDDWIVLRYEASLREAESQAESISSASAFIYQSNVDELLREDAAIGAFEGRDLHEGSTGINGIEFYGDPYEAVWAPWVEESKSEHIHVTVDSSGNVIEIPLRWATCVLHWQHEGQETESWLPAYWIRHAVEIVDVRNGIFRGPGGEAIGATQYVADEPWRIKRLRILLMRRQCLERFLDANQLHLGWGLRLWREPSYPLNVEGGVVRMLRHWRGIGFYDEGTVSTIQTMDSVEEW